MIQSTAKTSIVSNRVNEVGNKIEDYVKNSLNKIANGYTINTPETSAGRRRQATGYPDFLVRDKYSRPTYLECKTYKMDAVRSTMRSFYFSTGSKINYDARHIVIAFGIERSGQNTYQAKISKLIDIYSLPCKLKLEWNSNNHDLYGIEELSIPEEL